MYLSKIVLESSLSSSEKNHWNIDPTFKIDLHRDDYDEVYDIYSSHSDTHYNTFMNESSQLLSLKSCSIASNRSELKFMEESSISEVFQTLEPEDESKDLLDSMREQRSTLKVRELVFKKKYLPNQQSDALRKNNESLFFFN